MGGHHVVGLHEGLLARLPVHRHHLGDVHRDIAVLHRQGGLRVGERPEEVRQGRGLGIGIDEYEAAIATNLRLRKAVVVGIHAGEVPLAGDLIQRSIEAPRPPVECAPQHFGTMTVALAQFAAAMEAGIAVGGDVIGTLAGSHDEIRQIGDVVHDIVAHAPQFVFVAGQLPHLLPQQLDFKIVESPRVVHRGGNPHIAGWHR